MFTFTFTFYPPVPLVHCATSTFSYSGVQQPFARASSGEGCWTGPSARSFVLPPPLWLVLYSGHLHCNFLGPKRCCSSKEWVSRVVGSQQTRQGAQGFNGLPKAYSELRRREMNFVVGADAARHCATVAFLGMGSRDTRQTHRNSNS